ncbi:hypothetical protein [Bdellovibrio sp. HCB288]|uniref:hypothetical protein n=1 Tax=Bdellovibrio sp. HCB288 TaxID=3394355 RepID=UPI0039B3B8C7
MNTVVIRNSSNDLWDVFAADCLKYFRPYLKATFVDYLNFTQANRAQKLKAALGGDMELVVALCHGDEHGNLYSPASQCAFNISDVSVLEGKFCYLVACYAGARLGPKAMAVGAAGFVGFDRSIITVSSPSIDRYKEAICAGLIERITNGTNAAGVADVLRTELRRQADIVSQSLNVHDLMLCGAMLASARYVVHS